MKRHERQRAAAKNAVIQGEQHAYRTVCTTAVLRYLGCERWRYSQTIRDCVQIARRHGYHVRSRKSAAGSSCQSIAKLRDCIRSGKLGSGFFLVRVPGHAMLLDAYGRTIVDTDPRVADRRTVTHVYCVTRHEAELEGRGRYLKQRRIEVKRGERCRANA